jgi:hypothetical protein
LYVLPVFLCKNNVKACDDMAPPLNHVTKHAAGDFERSRLMLVVERCRGSLLGNLDDCIRELCTLHRECRSVADIGAGTGVKYSYVPVGNKGGNGILVGGVEIE